MSECRWHIAQEGPPSEPVYRLVAVSEDCDDHLATVEVLDHVVAGVHHANLTWQTWQDVLAELFAKQQAQKRT